MELVNVQTYLNRILKPEEFSIQSATKRLDIFEEDRKRIMRSPWFPTQDEECTRPKLASKSGVYDFFTDWTPDILTDLNQLSDAVDHVLGIVPQNHVDQPPNNVEPSNYSHVNNINNDLNKIKEESPLVIKSEPVANNSVEVKPDESSTPTDIKTEPTEVKPVVITSTTGIVNNEIKKNETKEESRKKELQEELKNLKTDDYNPNDIFDPTADSDDE